MYRIFSSALLLALLLSGCVVAPAPVVVAPALPGVVILDVEPYYYQQGYYYYYHNDRWSYSRDKVGPWKDLPRDRYPNDVRFKGRDKGHDSDRGPEGPDRSPGRGY